MIKLITLMILMTSSVDYTSTQAEVLAHDVIDAARSNDLDPVLYAALVTEESHWNDRARSSSGAYGMPQLNPRFWPQATFKTRWSRLYQGATILAGYRDRCGGEWRAVAAYRSGSCRTVGPATKKVFRTYRMWSGRISSVEW